MTSTNGVENLEEWFPRDLNGKNAAFTAETGQRLGVVVGGSLSKGLTIKLDPHQPIEELAVGRYIVVRGLNKRFFCMITDVALDSSNPGMRNDPPEITGNDFLRDVYIGTAAYAMVSAAPMLAIDDADGTPRPVKTIPGHFMPVVNASEADVNAVFGTEDENHFNVGSPLELETTQINLDLRRLVERSVGVFGKSGTGKSFLTRMLLAGIIQRKQAVSLIFDMHSDYGWEATNEGGPRAKGLKQLFPSKVSIITLDPESTQRRGGRPDFEVKLGYDEIEPEDIAMLRESMNLSDAMIDAAYTLAKMWGKNWVRRLIELTPEDVEEVEAQSPTKGGTMAALQRRLQRFERWGFLVPQSTGDTVSQILNLLNNDKSVVLEFGRYGNSIEAYVLVANYLTRRIHEQYVERVEKAFGDPAMEPPQLLITIEEAHKFLDPRVASQTTFGIIARELRKYKVTLMVVDQRPSGIDEEVMSQIGTRVTALLDNERDVNAVLSGISGAAGLREVLARLDTKQQAIIMGHAVPMPVVVKTRSYNDDFYAAMLEGSPKPEAMASARAKLGNSGDRRIR